VDDEAVGRISAESAILAAGSRPVVLLDHAVNRDARRLTFSEDPSPNLARGAVDKLSYGSKPTDFG
jgi:hypothetical protein